MKALSFEFPSAQAAFDFFDRALFDFAATGSIHHRVVDVEVTDFERDDVARAARALGGTLEAEAER